MNTFTLIKLSVIALLLNTFAYSDWTENGTESVKFTKPIHFWNSIVTTSTTQQTSMNSVFPFSTELQAMNAIFQIDSEGKKSVRIRLDEASMTNLANFATTNIALQVNQIAVFNYATGIWSVATATNSSKVYADTLVSSEATLRQNADTSETTLRIAGDLASSNYTEGAFLKKTGGTIGGNTIVTGTVTSITSGAFGFPRSILYPNSIKFYNKSGNTFIISNLYNDSIARMIVDNQIRCPAPSDNTEVALLSTVKTATNWADIKAQSHDYVTKAITNGLSTIEYTDNATNYFQANGGKILNDVEISGDLSMKKDIYLNDNQLILDTANNYTINKYDLKGIQIAAYANSMYFQETGLWFYDPTIISNVAAGTADNNAVNVGQLNATNVLALLKSGGTMTGNLIMDTGDDILLKDTSKLRSVTGYGFIKFSNSSGYDDIELKTQPMISDKGIIILNANKDVVIAKSDMNTPTSVVTKSYVDLATNQCASLYVNKSGDTMTGDLNLDMHKLDLGDSLYIKDSPYGIQFYNPTLNGSMYFDSGLLWFSSPILITNVATPTAGNMAANKSYVDNADADKLNIINGKATDLQVTNSLKVINSSHQESTLEPTKLTLYNTISTGSKTIIEEAESYHHSSAATGIAIVNNAGVLDTISVGSPTKKEDATPMSYVTNYVALATNNVLTLANTYTDTATNSLVSVFASKADCTNISDYISLNNISNYIYKLEASNDTISGSTQTWIQATINLKNLIGNGADANQDRTYDIQIIGGHADDVSISGGTLQTIISHQSYKVIKDSGHGSTIKISLKDNDTSSGFPVYDYMYVTYGQSTEKITFTYTL